MRRWDTVALCHPCTTQQCRRGRAPHEAGPIRRLHGNEYAHGPRPDGDGRGCLRRAGDCGPVMSGSLAIAAAGPGGAPLLRPGSGAWLVRAAAARSSRARIVAVATRCRITLLRVAPTPSGGGRQVPASQPGGLCPCWVRLMSASSTGNRAPVRPVAAHRSATVMASPRCPGSRNSPAPAWRYRAGPRTGRPGSPWQTHPYRHPRTRSPASPLARAASCCWAREELTSSISSWATNTHPSGRPAGHHGKGPRSRGQGQPAPVSPGRRAAGVNRGWPCASSTQAVLPPASCGGLGDGPLLGWDMSGNAVLCDIPPGRPGHCWFRRGLPAVPGPPSRRPRMGRPCGAVPVGTSWLRGSAARHARGGALLADAGMGPAAAGPRHRRGVHPCGQDARELAGVGTQPGHGKVRVRRGRSC